MEKAMKDELRKRGKRATPARLLILGALKKSGTPLSLRGLAKKLPRGAMDQATLYRNIDVLLREKLVRPVDVRHRHAHYELADSDHHHLICTDCGRIEEFTGCDAASLARTAMKQSGKFARISEHSIELFGVCKACA